MGARNLVGIGLSYRPARLHWLAELIHGLLKKYKNSGSPLSFIGGVHIGARALLDINLIWSAYPSGEEGVILLVQIISKGLVAIPLFLFIYLLQYIHAHLNITIQLHTSIFICRWPLSKWFAALRGSGRGGGQHPVSKCRHEQFGNILFNFTNQISFLIFSQGLSSKLLLIQN